MIDRILALLVGGPVRSVIAGALVVSPIVLLLGWWGVGLSFVVAGVGATVWWRRQAWNGAPRPW